MKKQFLFLSIICIVNLANAQWQQIYNPVSIVGANSSVTCLTTNGNKIFAGAYSWSADYQDYYSYIYYSSNNGSSWSIAGSTGYLVMALATSGNNLFAGQKPFEGLTCIPVILSTNDGSSWAAIINGLSTYYKVFSLAISGNNIFAGTNSGVCFSSNNGSNWTNLNIGSSFNVYSLAISGNNIFAGGNNGGIILSTDNGSSWVSACNGLPGGGVYALAINGSNIFAGISGYGVYLSTDNGSNWAAVNNGLPTGIFSITSFAVDGSNIFAGQPSSNNTGGVYFSSNNGNSWIDVSNGLTNKSVRSLSISGGYIFAGTDNGGIWRLPLSGVGNEEINKIESDIAIYPNPVNNYITIESPQQVIIEISNSQSQLFKTIIVSGNKTNINVSNFPCGMYLLKVKTEKGIITKKFIKL